MKTKLVAAQAAIVVCFWASNAAAINVLKDEEEHRSLDVGVLIQPQVQLTANGAPDGSSLSTDFFLRRARMIVSGEVLKGLTFFLDTDQPNWGKNGVWDGPFIVQDAFGSYQVVRELNIDVGMMLVPFTHNTIEGAGSLHALDYHAAMIHFPTGVGPAFRDAGVQLRGVALGDHLHYRAGVYEGVRGPAIPAIPPGSPPPAPGSPATLPLNSDGEPRFTGMVRLNILGVEDTFFVKGIYFAEAPMLSIGVGADYQHHVTRTATGIGDHAALSADVFFEFPFTENDEILAKAALVHYSEGAGSIASGTGAFGEVGFRHAWFEPLVGGDTFHADDGIYDYHAFKGGLNFWLKKYTANLKAELAYTVADTPTTHKTGTVGTLQGQIYF